MSVDIKSKVLEVLEKNYQVNLFSAQARESVAVQIENKLNGTEPVETFKSDEVTQERAKFIADEDSNKKEVKEVKGKSKKPAVKKVKPKTPQPKKIKSVNPNFV